MKLWYGLAVATAGLFLCGLFFVLQSQGVNRYQMLTSTATAGTSMFLVDGKTGKTWQLVTVEDDPTGSADFWSPIDRLDSREAATKRLESLGVENPGEVGQQEPISLRMSPRSLRMRLHRQQMPPRTEAHGEPL